MESWKLRRGAWRRSSVDILGVVCAPRPRKSTPVREELNCHLVAEPEAKDPRIYRRDMQDEICETRVARRDMRNESCETESPLASMLSLVDVRWLRKIPNQKWGRR